MRQCFYNVCHCSVRFSPTEDDSDSLHICSLIRTSLFLGAALLGLALIIIFFITENRTSLASHKAGRLAGKEMFARYKIT